MDLKNSIESFHSSTTKENCLDVTYIYIYIFEYGEWTHAHTYDTHTERERTHVSPSDEKKKKKKKSTLGMNHRKLEWEMGVLGRYV